MLKILFTFIICLTGVSALADDAADLDQALEAAQAGDMSTAWAIWKPLADAGNARAQSNIGVMYDKGLIVAEDDAEAVRWFTRAAESGFPTGQFNLAAMYKKGEGVALNLSTALQWFQAAARQGHPQAQMALVEAYYMGNGTAPDFAKAYMWIAIAAEAGFAPALENLADFESRVGQDAAELGQSMAVKCIPIGLANCP